MRVAVEYADCVRELQPVVLPYTYRPAPALPAHTDGSALPALAEDAARYAREHEAARQARIDAFDAWLRAESLRTAPGYLGSTPGVLTPTRAVPSPRANGDKSE